MKFAILATAALALTTAPATAATNLLVNGSFDDVTGFAPDGQGAMTLFPGAATMTGWTVVNSSLSWDATGSFGVSAKDGATFLDLTGYQDGAPFGGVTQTIATVAGHIYSLGFALGSSNLYGASAAITATAGTTSQTFGSSGAAGASLWEDKSLLFTATGATTTITLTGTAGSQYIGLDSASVVDTGATAPVPEPGQWAMMIAGLGLAGAAARRRRAA